MTDMDRREFLTVAACCAAASMVPSARYVFSQDRTKVAAGLNNTLVVIYLRGGMDAINALVPYGDKTYYEIRPTIAIPKKDDEDGPGVIPLDDTWGLHPSLKALKPYWDSKQFAAIINAGSPHGTRSHFDAQDFMEYAAPGMRTVKEGWLNRYLRVTQKQAEEKKTDRFVLRAIAMQGLLPRALRGSVPVLAVPDKHVLNNDKVLDTFKDLYQCEKDMEQRPEDPVVNAGRDTLETLERYKDLVEKRKKERKVSYPTGPLSQKLQDIAAVIHADAGLEVAAIDIGGWDHHVNEGGNTGTLANMLKNYAETLDAFAKDLGDRMRNVMVLTMTEFGRTCRENGNRGTDHGHGGVMFLLGGTVQGGKVHGKWTGLAEKALYEGRDLPVTTDFRDVMAEVLRQHMKCDLPKDFFPNYKPNEIKGLF